MELADIGSTVRTARKAAGLSQKDLARLAGLSRATLNYLENEPDTDMGAAKLLVLLDILGITVAIGEPSPQADDDAVARALTASGPRKQRLTVSVLTEAVITGRPPVEHRAALSGLLASMSTPAAVAVVRVSCRAGDLAPKAAWKHLRALAAAVDVTEAPWLTAG